MGKMNLEPFLYCNQNLQLLLRLLDENRITMKKVTCLEQYDLGLLICFHLKKHVLFTKTDYF